MAKYFTSLFISIFISLTPIFPQTKAQTNCSNEALHIHTKGQWPSNQNGTVFELRCKNNTTMIHFPSYGHDLAVKSLSLEAKKLELLDPKSCVHEVFLNLNLSLTPFRYYYVVKNFTYLNCSTKLSPSFWYIPCMSDLNHYVYTVDPSMDVPISCKSIKTIAIPFEYSPYLDDNSFGLALTWDSFQIENGGFTVGLVQVLAIGVAVFAAISAFLTINKAIYYSKNPVCGKESLGNNNQIMAGKFLGDYRAFSSCTDHHEAYVDQVNNRC